MKLLTKEEVNKVARQQNRELAQKNSRLVDFFQRSIKKLNNTEIDSDLQRKQYDYDKTVQDFLERKDTMLQELMMLQRKVEEKKDILYSLIDKQDELDERERTLREKEEVIKLQAQFVDQISEKITNI